ncbi:hypothetical protein JX265_003071 [Neoarthrinium moseri]|uniref:Pathway-specific nitrogen regulator n=1 Tax=Neoarthrinium moseri TaxID=1658444 RepID=A0A9P9WT86_9PEZI|nr:uncharacterized protein JN550_006001 [Neoarthrinium moseri]KAI1869014.1 hypothetical protein JN550_006001 [Neoarthrinium moseri]KAI1878894.1 hypothetical protein JX265_003071 [Neoarthrinium moseri]
MDDDVKSQHGDVEVAEGVAANAPATTHEGEPQVDVPETTVEATEDADDSALDTSIASQQHDDENEVIDPAEGGDAAEDAPIDDAIHDVDNADMDQDHSHLEDSIVDDDEASHHGVDVQAEEESVMPSIESEIVDDMGEETSSRKPSPRRASARTEALIQAAARDIVAQMETHRSSQEHEDHGDDSVMSYQTDGDQGDHSVLSSHTVASDGEQHDQSELSVEDHSELHEESQIQHSFHEESSSPQPADEAADSSSHHEGTDEDVFSDKSPRSSLGSYDGGSESGKGTAVPDNVTVATRTPRISDISQYDRDDDFIPTVRGTPRPPFRTPSDVHAMQMSSPAPSVFGSVLGSPRSSKRTFPTVSRLGSPVASAQYSPKNRTPSRFKVKEAPLVLLHVTLVPLRWMWGDVIDSLDPSEMSDEAKTLRESWRMLQDRMGDTVLERGILLGHPQNDYEILEERLLEALDLPMRRRARILECGHYLGPANEHSVGDDSEGEDDYETIHPEAKRHWCNTCKSDIRYDSLGAGRIFRVKVYASNGLMRAGAWAACWKEMERVDVELEPVVEPGLHEELARLEAALQEREAAQHQQLDIASEIMQQVEEQQDTASSEQPDLIHAQLEISSTQPEPATGRRSLGEERRRQDEERLREIYGTTPELPTEYSSEAHHSHPDSYIPPPSPRSPSEEAYERRESRRRSYQSDSLSELLLQSVKVLMQDRKNIVIIALSIFVLLMALRTTPQQPRVDSTAFEIKMAPQIQHSTVPEPVQLVQDSAPIAEPVVSYATTSQSYASQPSFTPESVAPKSIDSAQDPCSTQSGILEPPAKAIEPAVSRSASQEISTQRTTVRVMETVTETETLRIETVTETETMRVKATVTMTESSQAAKPTLPALEQAAYTPGVDGPLELPSGEARMEL